MGSVAGLGLCLSVVLPHGDANATCGYDCTGRIVNEDCSAVSESEGVHEWARTDGFHVAVNCSETCCGGGDCSTDEDTEPSSYAFVLRDITSNETFEEVEWEVEPACDGYLVSGSADLAVDRRYEFRIDTVPVATFDVVDDSGCSIGGRSRSGATLLFMLAAMGCVARRRLR